MSVPVKKDVMLNAVKYLYRSDNQFRFKRNGRGSLLLFSILFALLFLRFGTSKAQRFNFAGKEAAEIPTVVTLQIRQYIESHDGVNLKIFAGQYQYIPVFNVLNRSQKQFVDGVYFFT